MYLATTFCGSRAKATEPKLVALAVLPQKVVASIALSSLSMVLMNKYSIQKALALVMSAQHKEVTLPKHEELGKAFYTRYVDARANNISLSRAIVQLKALNYACLLGLDDFKASTALLSRCCQRRPPNRTSQLSRAVLETHQASSPPGCKPKTATRPKWVPTPKGGHKKLPAAKPKLKKVQTGSPADVKSRTQARPPVLKAKDFPALASFEPQTADMVVGSVSTAGRIGRLEALERTTGQREKRVAAFLNQIMLAVRKSFLDMFTAALTQTLPEIVAQVSDSVLAVEESGSGSALGGPVQPLTGTAPAPSPSWSPAT
ncbi:hypothetical protein HPB49_009394 [Dermacentor silvarum]|uniref:Uncharacterized protein n=1 Tax=Dermacentor silvarum TaxID=543639 RepID=A0ACB8D4F0_DERSI|nr:hypothetical protein HPB49_009394 [Dermacentor silvarum]